MSGGRRRKRAGASPLSAPVRTGLRVDVSSDGVRVPVARERVANLARGVLRAEGVRDAMVSIAFLGRRRMAALNGRHLGHRGPTDVLSFALARPGGTGPVLGDVYVCPDVARDNARTHGVPVRQELGRLVVHGTLHVLGYDHPDHADRESSPMWRRQERLLARLTSAQ